MKRIFAIGSLLVTALPLCLFAQTPICSDIWPAASVQEEGDEKEEYVPPRCTTCKNTGLLLCKEHDRRDCELEHNALYCSLYRGCESCEGAGWLDCPECEHEPAEAWIGTRLTGQRAGEKRWPVEIDEEMGFAPQTVESEHFLLVWELDSLKIEKRRREKHELAHIFLERLETLFEEYCQALVASEKEFSAKIQVMVWALPNDQEKASQIFCGNGHDRGVKLLGSQPVYSVCGARNYYRDDEELHRSLVHNVVHVMLSHQAPSMWIGNRKGGWADAGLAHWFEDRYFQVCTNYCYQEQNSNQDFKGGKWKPAVRKMVSRDQAPPVADVFEQNTDTLTLEMHAVSFSYVDYLLTHDGESANRLFRRLRARAATRDALRETFSLSPLDFEQAWREWVLATYPTR